jgi:hypothetical protein
VKRLSPRSLVSFGCLLQPHLKLRKDRCHENVEQPERPKNDERDEEYDRRPIGLKRFNKHLRSVRRREEDHQGPQRRIQGLEVVCPLVSFLKDVHSKNRVKAKKGDNQDPDLIKNNSKS